MYVYFKNKQTNKYLPFFYIWFLLKAFNGTDHEDSVPDSLTNKPHLKFVSLYVYCMLFVTSRLICLYNNKTDRYFCLNTVYKNRVFGLYYFFLTLFYAQHYKLIGYQKFTLYLNKKIN
jgi:hypothetical protein